jgi:hypothetical protein
MSAKFVKERFGHSNLRYATKAGVDVKSHRISFEAGISILLGKLGYEKNGKGFTIKK